MALESESTRSGYDPDTDTDFQSLLIDTKHVSNQLSRYAIAMLSHVHHLWECVFAFNWYQHFNIIVVCTEPVSKLYIIIDEERISQGNLFP